MFNEFLRVHDARKTDETWKKQSEEFRTFWHNKIMSFNSTYSDSELIRVIQILDAKGRRGTNNDAEGAAFVQIYQGDWVNIFSRIKENSEVKEDLNKILTSNDNNTIIDSINKLYRINPIKKLTGESAFLSRSKY